jgi:glutamate/tyrosine decarboxylase-like PLP-dependent enzyme
MLSAMTDRPAPLEISPERFRAAGHKLVDRIAAHLEGLRTGPVTSGETAAQIQAALGGGGLPAAGAEPERLLEEAAELLFAHSLYNGHPSFFGYITSSAAPIGALGDLLAASVNANVGGFALSPMATEIERQSIRWIAEWLGYPTDADGVLVSGGNMANFVCFLAGRRARTPWDIRTEGAAPAGRPRLRVYTSSETHTWVQKACDLFGLGTDALRWIPVDAGMRMDMGALEHAIAEDRARGDHPLMVVGTGGSVATGAVDPLRAIAELCGREGMWFHVDGAYGGLAAPIPGVPDDLRAVSLADSIAVDPHKWFYAPIEAGCSLVRRPGALVDAFSYHPTYYHFDNTNEVNFYERGPQNTRGFRALKVWLGLRQAGREGYVQSITEDIRLARRLYDLASATPRLQAFTHGLSITTFRYVPEGVTPGSPAAEEYLNKLNEALLTRMQRGGRAFPSNAVVRGAFLLRTCIVNFRTTEADVDALPRLVVEMGDALDREMRPAGSLSAR